MTMRDTPIDNEPTLTVQVEGTAREGLRLYVMGKPRAGMVHLREWRGEDWSAGPLEREIEASALYAEFERAHRERRRMSEELYRLRLWLEGIGS
jgi:hypothetical protein